MKSQIEKFFKCDVCGMAKNFVFDHRVPSKTKDEWEGHRTIRFFVWYDFSLKCRVYDVWRATAEDIHQVIYR